MGRGPSPRARRWRRILGAGALGLVMLAGVAFVGTWWYGQRLVGEFQAGSKGPLVSAAEPYLGSEPVLDAGNAGLPAASTNIGATTFLLIGSDSRGGSATGGNSDTMILARLNESDSTISLLSVPRDLKVPIPGHGEGKVNAAYARGGPALTIRTLRDYLGVRIDHFVVIDFAGFTNLVDDLGGVWLGVDQRYHHVNVPGGEQYAEIDLEPGYQRLEGRRALGFARYRHGDSDFFRQARQHLFLEQVKTGLASKMSLSGFTGLPEVLGSAAKATTSDLDSFTSVIGLMRAVLSVPNDGMHRFTIPGVGGIGSDGVYYLNADQGQVREVVRHFLDPIGTADQAVPDVPSSGFSSGGPVTSVPQRNAPALTTADGGEGERLVRSEAPSGMRACAPTSLAQGARWDSDTPVRAYELARHPALALVGELGPGRHYLWMQTSWQDPPVLAGSHDEVTENGRRLRLYWDGRTLRVVSFRLGDTNVWLTNTLRGDLSPATMRALAASCSPIT